MMNQETTKYVADWFARADEDLDIAQLILEEERPYNPACFHEQQVAEKYLKGFLAHHEKHVRKIHDLGALLQECLKIDQSFTGLQDSALYLSRFYVESRYPDDYIEFTREDAEKGLDAATRIKEFVLEKIESKQKRGFGIVGIIIVFAAVAVLGGGYWYWQSRAEVPLPPSSDQSPVVAEDDFTGTRPELVEGWKTYRNEQYGFEVKYPMQWQSAEEDPKTPDLLFLFSAENNGERFSVLIAFGADPLPPNASLYPGERFEEVIVANHSGRALFFGGGNQGSPFVRIAIPRAQYTYILFFYNTPELVGEYNQILSTFKFIPSKNSWQAN